MSYLLEASISCLVFLLVYKLLLENTTMHKLKRAFLLACLTIPFLIPLVTVELKMEDKPIIQQAYQMFDMGSAASSEGISNSIENKEQPEKQSSNHSHFPWKDLLVGLYALVAFVALARYFINVMKILLLSKQPASITISGQKVVISTKPIIPHNFLNTIFISRQDYQDDRLRDRLLTHEITHARQLHSLDILLLEVLKAIFWFNPSYYFLGKAIRLNHEYLADSEVIKADNNVVDYQKMLLAFISRPPEANAQLASFSNYSLTKKRFKMMTQKMSKTTKLTRLFLAAIAILVTTSSFILKTEYENSLDPAFSTPTQNEAPEVNLPDIVPLDSKDISRISSPFKMRTDPITREKKMHYGIDYSAKTGTPIMATAAGTIEKTENNPGRGLYIQIKHDDTYQTLYAHLSAMDVQTGDVVEKGQTIGKVGSTGKSTAPHLHYEIIMNGKRIDPLTFLQEKSQAAKKSLASDKATQIKYGLDQKHYMVNFGNDYKFLKIVYDDEKAVFFIKDKEPIVKNLTSLSQEAIDAIHALRLPPPPPVIKRSPSPTITENWLDFNLYGVWIDDKKVENEVLKNYKASDFGTYSISKLYGQAKKGKSYEYQLNLITNGKLKEYYLSSSKSMAEWDQQTRDLLDKINL